MPCSFRLTAEDGEGAERMKRNSKEKMINNFFCFWPVLHSLHALSVLGS